ncbi:MAG TPA: protein-disulfide reductase DsbD [Cellvibrionaceae bacterium]
MKLINRAVILLLWVCSLSVFSLHASAANDVSSLTQKAAASEEFLPVEQAYKVNVIQEGGYIYLDWNIAKGYYLYKEKFKIFAQTEQGKTAITPSFEASQSKYDPYFKKDVEIFHNATRVTLSTANLPKQFEMKLTSQGCADAGLCYAPHTQFFQIDLTQGTALETAETKIVAAEPAASATNSAEVVEQTAVNEETHSFGVYILLAIGGGMILNLMPCVFPVLSLKALTFASTSQDGHSHASHGWAYTFGVCLSFVIVAIAILALRQAGQGVGWGFQLQNPVFVAFVVYLFLVMGLSLSGMVHFGTSLMGVGQNLTAAEGLRGSFFTGVLAAVVASPCTGPLMAPAIGFALTQPWYVSIIIFIALGFGLALPFLALSYSPALAKMLPRPGMWMETLKQFLAFPMYLTSVWLLWVLGNQVGINAMALLVLGGIAITFALWLLQNQPEGVFGKTLVKGSAIAAIFYAGYVGYNAESFKDKSEGWESWSVELVEKHRSEGRPVFVDFTADWCITCKANEANAINREDVSNTFKKLGYATLKGDWTNADPKITAILSEFKRSGVPLYVVYPAGTGKAELLPQVLTKEIVIEALERNAASKKVAAN